MTWIANLKYENFLYSTTADKVTEEDYELSPNQFCWKNQTRGIACWEGSDAVSGESGEGQSQLSLSIWLNFHNIAIYV